MVALATMADRGQALADPLPAKEATAVTRVYGDGQRLVGVLVEYPVALDGSRMSPSTFKVEGRTVSDVGTRTSPSMEGPAVPGRFVAIGLSPTDPSASLKVEGPPGMGGPPPGLPHDGGRDPGQAPGGSADGGPRTVGDPAGSQAPSNGNPPPGVPGRPDDGMVEPPGGRPVFGAHDVMRVASADVAQVGTVFTADGRPHEPGGPHIVTSRTQDGLVDLFERHAFKDPRTGRTLRYNLFVPRGYDGSRAYPLVLFVHDAGALSHDVTTTLRQGLGAVSWAAPEAQARHPAFVLAPQYEDVTVDDGSNTSSDLETTVDLVDDVASRFKVDRARLYATGQSMGAMMTIAMDIAHPSLFAASYVVAGQWDAAKVGPLASQKLWILVSQGDLKAYPGENAIVSALEGKGAKMARAVWDGRSAPDLLDAQVSKVRAEGAAINYVALRKGTVALPGQDDGGGTNHMGTWRIAYSIPGIRDWLFDQHR